MTVTPVDFANKLKQHLGYAYRVGPSRCTGSSGYHDCSGYMCWAMNQLGLTNNLCTSSFAISIWCYDLGLRIGEDEARHTDGVFAVRGADFGRVSGGAVNGSDGHIVAAYVPSFGGTYEAMGRRYGVVRGTFDGRGWTGFYKIPGMSYGPPPPPPPPLSLLERTMIVQTHHYDADGKNPRPIPLKDANGEFVPATIIPALDGKSLELDPGASLRNDAPDGKRRKYVPNDLGGAKIIAIAAWHPSDGSTPGGVLRYSDGRPHFVRFS